MRNVYNGLALLIVWAGISAQAADVDVSKLPPAASKQVSYKRDIQPLFEKSCIQCHGPEKQKSKYRLDVRETAIKGGSMDEAAIIVGKSEKSPLVHYVANLVEDFEMPPISKKNTPLTKEEIGLVRAWVDQGAKYDN